MAHPHSSNLCAVPDCERPVACRNLCWPHYMRLRQHGDVRAHVPIIPRTRPAVERFLEKIDKQPGPDGCWLWTAARMANGYGIFGRQHGVNGSAHRFSYEWAFGPIPEGIDVCHRCDTPHCVRPDHLFLGTAQENMDDAIRKGRVPHGAAHYKAQLTDGDVLAIRARAATGEGYRALAFAFGLKVAHVAKIVRRDIWRHLP